MKISLSFLVILLFLTPDAFAQSDPQMREFLSLNWKKGPAKIELSGKASLEYDEKHLSLGSDQANRALELMGNLPSTATRYLFGRTDYDWFAVIDFTAAGHVKDDETIDADALLKALREGNVNANEERKKLGLRSMELVGWSVPPHYNKETKRLEWGTRLKTDGIDTYTVNYTSRLLGRTGYFSSTLVTNESELKTHVMEYNKVLAKFEFNSGERYSEFKSGDKVAEYGLAALVVGGAAAAVAKSKWLWKVVGVGLLAALGALWAFLKRFISRK